MNLKSPVATPWGATIALALALALAGGACTATSPASTATPAPRGGSEVATSDIGAAPTRAAAPVADFEARLLADRERIDVMIGDARCTRDDECRIVGIGARACGGPEAYRAWSTAVTDGAALQAIVDRDAATRREQLSRMGIAQTCDVLPVPGVRCVAPSGAAAPGRCTTTRGSRRD